LALPGDASVEAIRTAARQVLSTPSFKANAQQRATALAGIDGAANAADAVEALLASRQSGPIRCQQVA
jgi:UDP:flavonoid glycosyltransferase YjiC (YdhE family)